MTKEQLDISTFDGTITTTSNEVLEVNTSRADEVIVLIDDGSEDGTPAEYTMTQRIRPNTTGFFQLYDEVTAETSRSWVDSTFGDAMQFEFDNTSGSDSTYRITIISYRDI